MNHAFPELAAKNILTGVVQHDQFGDGVFDFSLKVDTSTVQFPSFRASLELRLFTVLIPAFLICSFHLLSIKAYSLVKNDQR